MVDKIGWNAVSGRFPEILGIAPMAGYIYDHDRYVNTAKITEISARNAMAIWIHHSVSDEVVRIDGCCPSNQCKANIEFGV